MKTHRVLVSCVLILSGLVLALAVSCGNPFKVNTPGDDDNGGDDSSGDDSGGGGNDPVDEIVNGSSAATAATHWSCHGPYMGCGDIAFFSDGTYHHKPHGGTSVGSGTWTKIGPAALVMNPGFDEGSSLTSINGAVSKGSFTANTATGAALYFGIGGGGL